MNKKLLFIIALVMFMVACGNPKVENEKVSLNKIDEKVSILDKEKEVKEVKEDKKDKY